MEIKKRRAIIFDVDGTLAHMNGRISRKGAKVAPFADLDAYDDDVDEHVAFMLSTLKSDFDILIVSGRKSSSRDVLKTWLKENDIYYDDLFMRDAKDNRPDYLVKEEIYLEDIEPYYDVYLAFDDRDQVVKKWRELGIKVFQVQEGSF